MDADGACAERPAKKFRSEDGECASPIDADGACAESPAKKFRAEDGKIRPADSSTQTYHESVMRHLAFTRFKQLPVGDRSEHAIADRGASATIAMQPRQLLPAALRAHLAVFESRGQKHCACPRYDRFGCAVASAFR